MARRINLTSAALAVGLLCSSAASATETITYTYDARGRLIKVVHTGSVNNNNQACYTYDKADNRTNVKTDVGSLPACP
jgi:YD repeat-containing protein